MSRRARDRYLDGTTLTSRVAATGYRGFIKSIQRGSISLNVAATGTATITAVDMNNSVLRYLGATNTDASTAGGMTRVTFTNSTTITADKVSNGGIEIVQFEVTEYYPGVIKTVRRGSITVGIVAAGTTSATDTFAAVNMAKTSLELMGSESSDTGSGNVSNAICSIVLTNATTVTCTFGNVSGAYQVIASYQLVEYY